MLPRIGTLYAGFPFLPIVCNHVLGKRREIKKYILFLLGFYINFEKREDLCLEWNNQLFYVCGCSPADALLEAFIQTDVAFRKELDLCRKSKGVVKKDWHPGCTAVAALIVRNRLFVANAGDCRAILCRAGQPIALTQVGT